MPPKKARFMVISIYLRRLATFQQKIGLHFVERVSAQCYESKPPREDYVLAINTLCANSVYSTCFSKTSVTQIYDILWSQRQNTPVLKENNTLRKIREKTNIIALGYIHTEIPPPLRAWLQRELVYLDENCRRLYHIAWPTAHRRRLPSMSRWALRLPVVYDGLPQICRLNGLPGASTADWRELGSTER